MTKNTTKLMKTPPLSKNKSFENRGDLEVHPKTLKRILQFAAAYRTEKTAKDIQIDLFLN